MSITTLALVIILTTTKNEGRNIKRQFYLDGLGTGTRVWLWHPVLMVSAFGFCMSQALLSFRTLPLGKAVNKYVHAFWHSLSWVCIGIGLVAIWRSHDRIKNNPLPDPPGNTVYLPNLYTPHSMVGIAVVSAAAFNYVSAILAFLVPVSFWEKIFGAQLSTVMRIKSLILPNHVVFGIFIYVGGIASILAGTAETYLLTQEWRYYNNQYDKSFFATEAQWQGANTYILSNEDNNPAEKYRYLPDGCKVAAGLGISAILTLLCVLFATLSIKVGGASDTLRMAPTTVASSGGDIEVTSPKDDDDEKKKGEPTDVEV